MLFRSVDKIEKSGDTKIVVNQKSGSTLKVYPNPVENILKIDYKETSDHLEIDIYDIEGKKQMTKKIKTFPAEINVSKLSKGSYIVRCSNKQGFNESMNIIIK